MRYEWSLQRMVARQRLRASVFLEGADCTQRGQPNGSPLKSAIFPTWLRRILSATI